MVDNKLLTPTEMMELSEKGKVKFKESVLQGSKLQKIIRNIEDAALNGHTSYRRTILTSDDVRELQVIREYLKENGYHCEFETETRQSLMGQFNVNIFIVSWDQSK